MGKTRCPCCDGDWSERMKVPIAVAHDPEYPTPVPFTFPMQETDDALEAMFSAAFMSGAFPYHRANTNIRNVVENHIPVPGGGQLVRETRGTAAHGHLIVGDGWIALGQYFPRNKSGSIEVIATSSETAQKVFDEAMGNVEHKEVKDDPLVIPMNFWFRDSHGYQTQTRKIDVMTWEAIKDNYPAKSATQLERLVAVKPDNIRGRLLLLHGEPGTGKTTFLRCLASEWRQWCQVDYILDPEVLFTESGYLVKLMMGSGVEYYDDEEDQLEDLAEWEVQLLEDKETGAKVRKRKWRLLILEDTGELMAEDAKSQMGQAVARLLNLADGILGQGTRLMVAITTNEEFHRLSAAATRSLRALAQVEIPAMSAAEARAWMGGKQPLENREYTLADLILLREGGEIATEETSIGQFL